MPVLQRIADPRSAIKGFRDQGIAEGQRGVADVLPRLYESLANEMKCRVTGGLVDLSECDGKCSECEYGVVRFIPRRVIKERQVRDECRTEDSGS